MADVSYHIHESIAEISLTRGPVNALDLDTVQLLLDALEEAGKDNRANVVVLSSGVPGIFCAGLDFSVVRGASSASFRTYLEKVYKALFDIQYNLGKPSIAMVDGAARGAGITLGVSCDMIVASDRTELAYPEIDVGIIPGIHFAHLYKLVGRYVAFELLFTGRKFSAGEAKELGMVNQVTTPENLRETTFALAAQLAAKPRHVMRIGRNTFHRFADVNFRRDIENVIDTLSSLIEMPETQSRLAAVANQIHKKSNGGR